MKNLADIAYELARKGHAGQTRKDGVTPYINHPMDVADLLKAWGVSDNASLAAAYVHDLLEDTAVSKSEIRRALGPAVLRKVEKLTHAPDVPKDEYIRGLAEDADIWCVLIKAADRLCNTLDFAIAGNYDYARKYFAKGSPVFARLERDRARLGDIYARYARDKKAVMLLLLTEGGRAAFCRGRKRTARSRATRIAERLVAALVARRMSAASGKIRRAWREILRG